MSDADLHALRRRNRILLVGIGILAVSLLVTAVQLQRLTIEIERLKRASPFEPGALLPPLTVKAADGTGLDTAALRGAPFFIVFASPGCPVCHERAADWNAIVRAHFENGLRAIAIIRGGSAEETRKLRDALDPAFVVLAGVEDPAALAAFRGDQVPRAYLADRWGRLLLAEAPLDPLDPEEVAKKLLARYPEMQPPGKLLALAKKVLPEAARVTRRPLDGEPDPRLGPFRLDTTDAAGAPLGTALVLEQDLRCPVCHDLRALAGLTPEGAVKQVHLLRPIEAHGEEKDAAPFLGRLAGTTGTQLATAPPDGITGATKSSRALTEALAAAAKRVGGN